MNNSLTVKWVRCDGGVEYFPAQVVSTIPDPQLDEFGKVLPHRPQGTPWPAKNLQLTNSEDGVRIYIDSGTVYIMNASGKTIDTHHFQCHTPGYSSIIETVVTVD